MALNKTGKNGHKDSIPVQPKRLAWKKKGMKRRALAPSLPRGTPPQYKEVVTRVIFVAWSSDGEATKKTGRHHRRTIHATTDDYDKFISEIVMNERLR